MELNWREYFGQFFWTIQNTFAILVHRKIFGINEGRSIEQLNWTVQYFYPYSMALSRIGPVDKSKNSAEIHSSLNSMINLEIEKDGIYHPLKV